MNLEVRLIDPYKAPKKIEKFVLEQHLEYVGIPVKASRKARVSKFVIMFAADRINTFSVGELWMLASVQLLWYRFGI